MGCFGSLAFILLMFAAHSTVAAASDWPKLDGSSVNECRDASRIASAAFHSKSESIEVDPESVNDTNSELVFDANRVAYTQGEKAEFVRLPREDRGGSAIYWQKSSFGGRRIVVAESAHGWRHETYAIYIIDGQVSPGVFLSGIDHDSRDSQFSPLIADPWSPPQLFRDKHSGQFWIIDEGRDHVTFGAWRVLAAGPDGIEHRCTLHFQPQVKDLLSLLPASVRRLAILLDQTMGRGDHEGTLNQTARLRHDASLVWANIALRPWAVAGAYNTREEVDAGLQRWAQQGRLHRNAYRQIQQQIPLAERALATYFHDQYGRSTKEAIAAAEFVLDVAIRSHFAFHVEDISSDVRRNGMASNPW